MAEHPADDDAADDGSALPPGSTIGILGGGQLGRMLALAAARLGLKCHIYCPDPESPAFDVAAAHTVAAYEDADALDAFARAVDVVTYEFENVDVSAAERIGGSGAGAPGAAAARGQPGPADREGVPARASASRRRPLPRSTISPRWKRRSNRSAGRRS